MFKKLQFYFLTCNKSANKFGRYFRRGDLEILTFIIFTCFQFFVLLFRNPDIWDDVFNFDVFVASNDSRITAGVEVEEEALLLDPQMF